MSSAGATVPVAGRSYSLTSPSGLLKLVTPTANYDEEIVWLRSHPETRRYLPPSIPYDTVEGMRKRRECAATNDTFIDLVIQFSHSDQAKFVGVAGLYNIDRLNGSCSIGVFIHPDHFRGGLATQALYTLMKFAFEDEKLHRLAFETGEGNIRMRNWLENAIGARIESRRRGAWKVEPGVWVDVLSYSILENEWQDNVKEKLEGRIGSAQK